MPAAARSAERRRMEALDSSRGGLPVRSRWEAHGRTWQSAAPASLQDALDPKVVIDDDGAATFAGALSDGASGRGRIQLRSRSPRGPLGPVTDISPADGAFGVQLDADADGDDVIVWGTFRPRSRRFPRLGARTVGEGDARSVARDLRLQRSAASVRRWPSTATGMRSSCGAPPIPRPSRSASSRGRCRATACSARSSICPIPRRRLWRARGDERARRSGDRVPGDRSGARAAGPTSKDAVGEGRAGGGFRRVGHATARTAMTRRSRSTATATRC
jgi:hypothetical protein